MTDSPDPDLPTESPPVARMAVNVSGQQFVLKDFPQLVAGIIKETGIDASMLELEITESVVMKDEAWAEQALAQLKEQGVMLAIDDFGTAIHRWPTCVGCPSTS